VVIRLRNETVTTQQGVGLGRRGVGLEVVALLQPHRVDLLARHELLDRDLAAAARRELGEVVVGEHHHLAVVGLVALGDVGVLDLLAVDAAHALVADPPAVLGVHLAEGDVVALGGGVQLDRHADQPERHRALPDRPRHLRLLVLRGGLDMLDHPVLSARPPACCTDRHGPPYSSVRMDPCVRCWLPVAAEYPPTTPGCTR
jgi:hypothetical protein